MIGSTFLQYAYPFEHSVKEKTQSIVFISLFLGGLMTLLQPYGFVVAARLPFTLGYLLIVFTTLYINYAGLPLVFPTYFEDSSWSVKRAFLFWMYNFIQIGIWIHILNWLIIKKNPVFLASGAELGLTIVKILILGGFASWFLIMIRYNFITRKNLQVSQDLNQHLKTQLLLGKQSIDQDELIALHLENKPIEIPRSLLAFIRSEGNYLAFHFKPGSFKSPHLLRGRMKELEESLQAYPEFFRCHRSFMVNLHFIEATKGNSQGLNIQLMDIQEILPVARPKIKSLRLHLENKWSSKRPFIT